jgi:hypothetical protein
MYRSSKQPTVLGQIMQTLAQAHEENEIREIMGDLVMQLHGCPNKNGLYWVVNL